MNMKNFDIDKWSKYPQENNVIKSNDRITNLEKTNDDLEYLITQIENDKKDITGSYDTWLKIGFAIADHFGEDGRNYFQRVSQFHPEYDSKVCDDQFDKCLGGNGSGITIKSFFHLCFQNNIFVLPKSSTAESAINHITSNPINSSNNLHIRSLNDMIIRSKTEPAIPYLWSGIKIGSFGFIFGPPKAGKTIFCECLAMAIATQQESFFNKPILQGAKRVLFISMEEFWQQRTERNEKQLQELQAEVGDFFLTVDEHFPRLINSKEDWELLKDHIIQTDSEVVFIDSLSRLYSGSIEDSQMAKELLFKLRELTNELKITLIIIHHTPKQIGRPLTIDSLAGSRMLAQEADFMIGISKSLEGTRYMKEVAFRYAPENDETVTTFQINSNTWIHPLFEVPEQSLLKESDGRNDSSNKDTVLDYIESSLDANSQILIKALIDYFVDTRIMSKPTLYACLQKLTTERKIKKIAKGVYALSPEQP